MRGTSTGPSDLWHLHPYIELFGFIMVVVLLSALYYMLYRTRFGASVRASLADQTAAALVGIDVRKVSTICFGIGWP